MTAANVTPWEWSQLAACVAQGLGLHFPPERRADLERGIVAAAQGAGLADAATLVRGLLAAPPGRAQLALLARHLTIGETYFFRDRPLLDAVARQVLPELIRQRRGRDQRLRLWSAGCASGEEAYSLAILVHRLLPDLADWRVTITATDIHPGALQKAAAGIYGEWSFRDAPAGLKATYFERRPDGRHAIAPWLRGMVDFRLLNLAQDGYPSAETGTAAMDIVFCRNVLMYFTPQQADRVLARLHAALVDGGWLALSPSETVLGPAPRFRQVNFPGAFLYRKNARGRDPAPASPATSAPAVPAAAPTRPALDAARLAAKARAHADAGRLAEALHACDRWLAADGMDPAAHYLRAVVLMEQGDAAEAAAALRRTLFLEPDFVLAHFALGNLARGEGKADEAERHFALARKLQAGVESESTP